jgi:glutamate-1-semialdehyde 2,1-aminomutase
MTADLWPESRRLLDRARRSLAGGVSSPFRARAPVPLYFRDGCGSRLQDADGRWYIDYTLGWGPNILGYRHPRVVEALRRAAEGVHTYGAQHELEFEVAERIQRLVPCAERVMFALAGTEAVQLSWRLARAATGRETILKFEGHYHGWSDGVLVSYHPRREELGRPAIQSRGQVANTADNVAVAGWNSLDAVERALAAGGIAAVVMEPVLCNSGCIMPEPGYLEGVAVLCRRHGALLIFDEVITGFRIALGGAQSHFGVTPDLATFGKAVGGGMPLSAVAGPREILELMYTGGVAFGGSFNGNPPALAAARATLDTLAEDSGAALGHANRLGESLMRDIGRAARRRGVPLLVTGFGAAFAVHFTERESLRDYADTLDDDRDSLRRLVLRLLAEGVAILPDGRFYVSAVHSEDDAARTLDAFDRALSA